MPETSTFVTEKRPSSQGLQRFASLPVIGSLAVLAILLIASLVLFASLPDANVFNDRVEQIFVENDALNSPDDIRLLEILAQSGTAFSEVLLIFTAALLVAAFSFLFTNLVLSR